MEGEKKVRTLISNHDRKKDAVNMRTYSKRYLECPLSLGFSVFFYTQFRLLSGTSRPLRRHPKWRQYKHCCLKHVNREPMNNTSLRERLNIEEGNSAMASRVIRQTTDAGFIRLYDSKANRKAYRYVPFWA